MNLKTRLATLEKSMEALRYQQRGVIIIGCCSCQLSCDDDYCEHEEKQLDDWEAEQGKEPDDIIRIIGVRPEPRREY